VIPFKAAPNGININVHCGSEFVRRDRAPLLSAVQGHNADLGIAFDGDADRVVFVTPEGMLVDGDHLMGILAFHMKTEGQLPGDAVVATDMSNSGLEHYLNANGVRLLRTKVGDRYVMEKLREQGLALGGEQAGHIILLDDERTCGDGIYVGLLIGALAAAAKRRGGPDLASLARAIPRHPQVIANAHLSAKVDLGTVAELQAARDAAVAAFGGIGRVNIRFSGTEPNLLRAMVEGGPATSLDLVVAHALALCALVARAAGDMAPRIDVVDCMTGAPVPVKDANDA
jgi:phosphoglucosamine mutase